MLNYFLNSLFFTGRPGENGKWFQVHTAGTLVKPKYIPFRNIFRTMHCEDYRRCVQKKEFIPSKITPLHRTLLSKGEHVFFRAESDQNYDENRNDWYGNVACILNLSDLLNSDSQIKLYNADYANFGCSSSSRILVTRAETSKYPELRLDSLEYGDPIIRQGEELCFASKHVRLSSKKKKFQGRHSVEFVFDLKTLSSKWLFEKCSIVGVDHSQANRKTEKNNFKPHQCLVFNSRKRTCTSPWTKEKIQEVLDDIDGKQWGQIPFTTIP